MIRLGIIAEELSDVAVIREISATILGEGQFGTKHFVGSGCGRLRRKCASWAQTLLQKGCTHLVVVHDLDDWAEVELRNDLTAVLRNSGATKYIVLIPVFEIEAWLLADGRAIQKVFSLRAEPPVTSSPESIRDPKARLEKLVWQLSRKRYFTTIHNERIAAAARLPQLERCKSFRPFPPFLRAPRAA